MYSDLVTVVNLESEGLLDLVVQVPVTDSLVYSPLLRVWYGDCWYGDYSRSYWGYPPNPGNSGKLRVP